VGGLTFGVGLAAAGTMVGTGTAATVGTFAVVGAAAGAAGDAASQGFALARGWQQGGYNWQRTVGAAVGGALGGALGGSVLRGVRTTSGRTAWAPSCDYSFGTHYVTQLAAGAAAGFGGAAASQGLERLTGQRDRWDWGEFWTAGATGVAGTLAGLSTARFQRVCFAAGTPLLGGDGTAKAIEEFRPDDWVLSRDEFDPAGAAVPKVVEEVFRRWGLIWHVHVGGQVVRTTPEHPFYAAGRGWVPANLLRIGDRLLGHDGQWVEVEDLLDTGAYEVVYNLRVADFHTFFVGCPEWVSLSGRTTRTTLSQRPSGRLQGYRGRRVSTRSESSIPKAKTLFVLGRRTG
jgi:hypothetical protein